MCGKGWNLLDYAKGVKGQPETPLRLLQKHHANDKRGAVGKIRAYRAQADFSAPNQRANCVPTTHSQPEIGYNRAVY